MGFAPTQPTYAGDGIAIWKAVDKNNKPYFKVKVLKGTAINCFKVEPKEEAPATPPAPEEPPKEEAPKKNWVGGHRL